MKVGEEMFNNLTVIEQIDAFFTELFSNLKNIVTWQTFWILLTGILVGFVLCSSIYGILLLKSVNKKEKEINKINEFEIDDKIKNIISDIKTNYVDESEGLPFKERFDILGKKIYETINRIATVYYPNSKYPLYELNIEELILLLHYLSNRIDSIFDKGIFKYFKKASLSQVFRILDFKKKIDDNKATKALKKANAGKIKNIIMTTKNLLNPVKWFSKLGINTTINFAFRKMTLMIIDIVAEETNKIYSKRIFDKERQLQELEIQKMLEEFEKEELDA